MKNKVNNQYSNHCLCLDQHGNYVDFSFSDLVATISELETGFTIDDLDLQDAMEIRKLYPDQYSMNWRSMFLEYRKGFIDQLISYLFYFFNVEFVRNL